ncbi:hypothetical protein HanXRQr2_Chr12g0538461 [Helianthus annuus]|uniref:Uncharacterized protein n=1 Tax=Helianthus annuus TaxID=4232 RepID=A0A9K3HG28_HELAN|nr:hypothetical protein HanXRQr2_Chr12g0538461 [Helianthus annuus]KAJ0862442.1 hypothetical protein HanPSC8_Chr12g0518281 [Helianthus annuus]
MDQVENKLEPVEQPVHRLSRFEQTSGDDLVLWTLETMVEDSGG